MHDSIQHRDEIAPGAEASQGPGIDPRAAEAFGDGVRFQRRGQMDRALARYAAALEWSPHMAEACYNMGAIHLASGNWPPAVAMFKRALDLTPDSPDTAFHLATALRKAGHWDKALAIYYMSLDLGLKGPQVHHSIGICHQRLGAHEAAARAIHQAAIMQPGNAQYWFHLAEACLLANGLEAAVAAYEKAIALKREWPAAHYNMAVALKLSERIGEAIYHLKIAVDIDAGYHKAYPLLYRLAQHACDWALAAKISRRLDQIGRDEVARGVRTTEPPMTHVRRCADIRANMQVARSWSEHLPGSRAADAPNFHFPSPGTGTGRLKIGYLSGDFRDHAVAHQVRGLFELHDRERFEIYGYATNPDDGTSYRQKLAGACDRFTDVHHRPNIDVARRIHRDGIHILVDMAGHTRDNRLGIAAMRPAPIQVSYLGFLSTTGTRFIDYTIADAIVVPEDQARFYSEKIAYLPHCYQANDNRMAIGERAEGKVYYNLPDQNFIFCSFNQPYKIDIQVFDIWMEILRQVGNSVLWLVERSPLACENLRRAARDRGVNPSRLIFAGFETLDRNLARLQLADLVLDTLIYNGGATTSNALWAGVPVLTTPGNHWVSRMSASALMALDMPELIAKDTADYRDKAVMLARQPGILADIRRRLKQQRTAAPLFDTPRFTRNLEKAYAQMWDRHAKGLRPASFKVEEGAPWS